MLKIGDYYKQTMFLPRNEGTKITFGKITRIVQDENGTEYTGRILLNKGTLHFAEERIDTWDNTKTEAITETEFNEAVRERLQTQIDNLQKEIDKLGLK